MLDRSELAKLPLEQALEWAINAPLTEQELADARAMLAKMDAEAATGPSFVVMRKAP